MLVLYFFFFSPNGVLIRDFEYITFFFANVFIFLFFSNNIQYSDIIYSRIT